ncbi:MAG: T9SS type A sorting domain-containing protein [Bacteroidetes bacterium]|nr:T9SS type A sorting domain-containing protein [Bacteroidota bacterium]
MNTPLRLLFVAILGISSFSLTGQTIVSSLITTNQTWDISGSPYIIGSNVLINQGVTVTVLPGTIIKSPAQKTLIVDGELVAKGKKDTVITFDSVSIQLTTKSTGYDFSSNTGSVFRYCLFRGNSMGGQKTIDVNRVSLLVSNCKFLNTYYGVYAYNSYYDTTKVRIENSIFDYTGFNYGYALYAGGQYTYIEMEECSVNNSYGIYITNHTLITKSSFTNWHGNSGLRLNLYGSFYEGDITITCNYFNKFRYSVIEMVGVPTKIKTIISYNTFDSSERFLDISLMSSSNKVNTLKIEYNNFLKYTKNSVFVHGGNNPGSADTLLLQNNYWGTTNTAQIDGGISDFNDDITVAAVIDYSSNLSAKQTQCNNPNPGGGGAGVKDIAASEFRIYPNPSSGNIQLEIGDNGWKQIAIKDLNGKDMIVENTNSNSVFLNCSSLNAGIYLVQVSGIHGVSQQKLLIQK